MINPFVIFLEALNSLKFMNSVDKILELILTFIFLNPVVFGGKGETKEPGASFSQYISR